MAFWGKSWRRSEREDSKTRYFQCGMNARQRLCGYCPHPRAPGALALSLDREVEKQGEGKRNSQRNGAGSPRRASGRSAKESARCARRAERAIKNAGQRLCGYCPHPRAPGALALSLDRERDLEKQGEGKRSSQTPGFVSFCSPQRSSDYETLRR